MKTKAFALALGVILAASAVAGGQAQVRVPDTDDPPGMLAPDNLAKPRPKPPFDLTGVWFIDIAKSEDGFRTAPKTLTPETQKMVDAVQAANARHEVLYDDTAACWPTGLPRIMTRVWPVQFFQRPSGIVMVAGFMNEIRWIYLDGRPHADPELSIPSWNGHSIAHYERDTLVIDTNNFIGKRHWMEAGIPVGEKAHLVERIKLLNGGKAMSIESTWTDPDHWVGEYKTTKIYNREDKTDLVENRCLPDTNDHIPGAERYGGGKE